MAVKKQKTTFESPPIYVVSGPEVFLRRQAVREITDRVLGSADRSLALSEYDGSSPSTELSAVLDDLRTLPFLTDRRLVFIRDADKFITDNRAELEDYAESPSTTGVLLLECRSFPATTRLYKRIQASGEVIACEALKSYQIGGWLTARARDAYAVRLDPQAGTLLGDFIGEDLGRLDAELHKLTLYVGERMRITAADVEAAVGDNREEQVWDILSAIVAGQEGRALTLWEEVLQTDRAAEGRSIAGIAYKVRQLLNAKRAQEAGAPPQELAKIMMLWRDPQRVQAELSAFTTGQVEEMIARLLDADVAAKSGIGSVQTAIESFIIEMCRARRPRRATG